MLDRQAVQEFYQKLVLMDKNGGSAIKTYDRKMKKLIKKYISHKGTVLEKCKPASKFLQIYYKQWRLFEHSLGQLIDLCDDWSLDTDFFHNPLFVDNYAKWVWEHEVIRPIAYRLQVLLLEQIKQYRRGDPSEHLLCNGIIRSFLTVESFKAKEDREKLYEDVIGDALRKERRKFYNEDQDTLLSLADDGKYKLHQEHVAGLLTRENELGKKFGISDWTADQMIGVSRYAVMAHVDVLGEQVRSGNLDHQRRVDKLFLMSNTQRQLIG